MQIVIAIDGFSGTGKSSTAKQVASRLGYTYIDSGAMYRAVTLFFLKEQVSTDDENEVDQALKKCTISFSGKSIFLNDRNVSEEIRQMKVSNYVSQISAISAVRSQLVQQQRAMGQNKGVVMDGRDIGTVVFPHAELKIFMTADLTIRAQRRKAELEKMGKSESLASVKDNLKVRDEIDSTRADSPLRKAADAIEIDTSHLSLDQQIDQIVEMAQKITHEY